LSWNWNWDGDGRTYTIHVADERALTLLEKFMNETVLLYAKK
jgi:hypothetical protein